MGDLPNFERGQIVGVQTARACNNKCHIITGVSRAAVSKVMSVYTNHGKTSLEKWNSGLKTILTETGCRTMRRTV
jgi:hypothetical protein